MHADSVFVIGGSHRVCEDYALTKDDGESICAVVSDGCSGSEDTDIGARILALKAAEHTMKHEIHYNEGEPTDKGLIDGAVIIGQAAEIVGSLGIDQSTLDATLFSLFCSGNKVSAFCSGDGFFVILNKAQEYHIFEIEMPSGYPLYLSYLLDNDRREDVLKQGEWWTVFHEVRDSVDDQVISTRDRTVSVRGIDVFKEYADVGETSRCAAVAIVFSDGVKSFVDENQKEIPANKIIRELTTFKSFKGEFVKRRMQGFLKSAKKRGWKHHDDLSMAAIYLGR